MGHARKADTWAPLAGKTIGSRGPWQQFPRTEQPTRLALVETASAGRPVDEEAIELLLTSGDRPRIWPGTDEATLQMALAVLRESRG